MLTWTTEPPESAWMRERGFRVLQFEQLLERFVRPGLAADTDRRTVASPFAGLLEKFDNYEAVAVRNARLGTVEELRAPYGAVMEPAFRRGCRLLAHADVELEQLRAEDFVEEDFGHGWTLERLRYLAGRMRRPPSERHEPARIGVGPVRLDGLGATGRRSESLVSESAQRPSITKPRPSSSRLH